MCQRRETCDILTTVNSYGVFMFRLTFDGNSNSCISPASLRKYVTRIVLEYQRLLNKHKAHRGLAFETNSCKKKSKPP